MAKKYETSIYGEQHLKKARKKGQAQGFVQGVASMLALGLLLKFLGWIPALLIVMVTGFVLYKVVTLRTEPDE